MTEFYIEFWTSEGIADRGEVSYETWNEWCKDRYVFGPFKSVQGTYSHIGVLTMDDDFEPFFATLNDERHGGTKELDGYWIVERQVKRGRRFGTERGDLPPFSDWSVMTELPAGVEPRGIECRVES